MNIRESTSSARLIEDSIRLACLLEATARKPGNVHPDASFDDLCHRDFVVSAEAAAPIIARSAELGVGRAVYNAVVATHAAVGRNSNLGILLLLTPLAAVPSGVSLSAGIARVLDATTREDASFVYRAIQLANPGGMGKTDVEDISQEPSRTLLDVMRLAAGRDAIAAQYADHFTLVFQTGVPLLKAHTNFAGDWEHAIIALHLSLMAQCPDTLIFRKCGERAAAESAARARQVLDAGWPQTTDGRQMLEQFDAWLRADGHRRNPGTTADLVTACLFAALREEWIEAPLLPILDGDRSPGTPVAERRG